MLLDKETLEGTGDDSDHLHSAASDQKPPFTCDSSCFNQFYERLVAPPKSGGAGGEDDQCKKVGRYVKVQSLPAISGVYTFKILDDFGMKNSFC